MLDWEEHVSSNRATLVLNGKITFESSSGLRTRTRELVLEHPLTELIFDMSKVRFIDSSGLGLLVSVKNTMVKREGTFSMINVKDTVRSIMNQTGLDRYFGI